MKKVLVGCGPVVCIAFACMHAYDAAGTKLAFREKETALPALHLEIGNKLV